jgi:hypothetical protein
MHLFCVSETGFPTLKTTNKPCMKRNISLIVLACEIMAIVVLHALKMSQAGPQKSLEISNSVSKSSSNGPVVRQYSLVVLK